MKLINLKLFFRVTIKDKIYFLINSFGLSIGIATVFPLFFWIMYEYNYDRFHKNFDNIYLVSNEIEFSKGKIDYIMDTPGPLAEYLNKNFLEVEKATTCQKFFKDKYIICNEKKFQEKGYAVQSSFFDIFSFKILAGDISAFSKSTNSIMISESLSKRLFQSNTEVVGKSIKIEDDEFFITGLFKDIPSNSSIKFDYILPITYAESKHKYLDNWNVLGYSTFVALNDNSDIDALNNKIKNVLENINLGEVSKRLFLIPVRDFHFKSDLGLFIENPGSLKNIYVLIFISIFILAISLFNYINISISRSEYRKKEIGIKQYMGVGRFRLMFQFFSESFLFTCFTSILSLLLVFLVIEKAQMITGKQIISSYINFWHIVGVVGIIGIASFFAGLYPAYYLSSLKPLHTIGDRTSKKINLFHRSLVVAQFVLVNIVLISVFVMHKQVDFMMKADLGYDTENLITFKIDDPKNADAIKSELLRDPNIIDVVQSHKFINVEKEVGGWNWQGNNSGKLPVFNLSVGTDFFNTLKIDLLKGKDFSQNEELRFKQVIINESAMKFMEIEDCIGMPINLGEKEFIIAGVVKDFHFSHLRNKIKPLLITYGNNQKDLFVRISNNNGAVIGQINNTYDEFNKSFDPFKYGFVSEEVNHLYSDENHLKNSTIGFLLILLLISMMGMIGMMTSHITKKYKEIGIRKAFGAEYYKIILFLLKDTLRMVILAYMIATPIAVFIIKNWVKSYENKVDIGGLSYLLLGLVFISFSLLVLSFQAIKVSRLSPVKILKDA